MFQSTSRQVYNNVILPSIGDRQLTVLKALEARPDSTNAELSQILNLPINCITPRVLELRKMGLVRQLDKRRCTVTGHTAIAWEMVPQKVEQTAMKFSY